MKILRAARLGSNFAGSHKKKQCVFQQEELL